MSLSDKIDSEQPNILFIEDVKEAVKELKDFIKGRKGQFSEELSNHGLTGLTYIMAYADIEIQIDEIFGEKLI